MWFELYTRDHHSDSPVGTDGGIVGYLIVVHSSLALLDEPHLLAVGPDTRGTSN